MRPHQLSLVLQRPWWRRVALMLWKGCCRLTLKLLWSRKMVLVQPLLLGEARLLMVMTAGLALRVERLTLERDRDGRGELGSCRRILCLCAGGWLIWPHTHLHHSRQEWQLLLLQSLLLQLRL